MSAYRGLKMSAENIKSGHLREANKFYMLIGLLRFVKVTIEGFCSSFFILNNNLILLIFLASCASAYLIISDLNMTKNQIVCATTDNEAIVDLIQEKKEANRKLYNFIDVVRFSVIFGALAYTVFYTT